MKERLIALLTNAKFYTVLLAFIDAVVFYFRPALETDVRFQAIMVGFNGLVFFIVSALSVTPQGQSITKRITVRLKGAK